MYILIISVITITALLFVWGVAECLEFYSRTLRDVLKNAFGYVFGGIIYLTITFSIMIPLMRNDDRRDAVKTEQRRDELVELYQQLSMIDDGHGTADKAKAEVMALIESVERTIVKEQTHKQGKWVGLFKSNKWLEISTGQTILIEGEMKWKHLRNMIR